jgi:hypothetical protein
MILQGKGFFTFDLPECEGGEPASILATAQTAGLSHVFVKIADGVKAAGIDDSGIDFTAPVVQTLRAAGIDVWGWHTVYGNNPSAEAAIALTRTQALGLDGYVVYAGEEYQHPGRSSAARQFMTTVHSALKVPIALSSYRFPNYHPELPWSTFLEFCDLHMPQVTWEQAHNAGAQLRESKRQCDALPNARLYIPTCATYGMAGWSPTAEEISDFLNTAKALGLPAVNFFDWDTCHAKMPLIWKTIASFAWPTPPQDNLPAPTPISTPEPPLLAPLDALLLQFLAALNSRDAAQATALYDPSATQVWADQILRNAVSIQAGFDAFFTSLPAGTVFTISADQVEDDLRMFSWKAGSLTGETMLVLKNGKIILDYTFIS